ncbi:MAG: sialidase family protein [Acidimicrobiales bacterium]
MRRNNVGAGIIAVLLLAGACSSGSSTGPAEAAKNAQVDVNDKLLPVARIHEGPALLIDRNNPNTVYLGETEMVSGECRFYVSLDGGLTWRPENAPVLEPYTKNCAMGIATSQNLRQELVQGPDGTIYNVFQANAPNRNGTRSVLLGRSEDGGRSWQTVAIDPGTPAPEPGVEMEVNFQGHVAIDPNDPQTVYAMWRRSQNNKDRTPTKPTRPWMSVSQDGGATWAPPWMMFEKNNGFDGPRPVVVGDTLYTFYRESAPPLPTGGAAPIPEPPTTKLFVNTSKDGGKTWIKDVEIARAPDASEPVPFYDRERRQFYVVWHDNRQQELDVYFSTSKDGATWAAPKRLNDDPEGTRYGQHYPQISMSPDGRIDVAWYDWRDDPFPASTVGQGSVLDLFANRGKMASVYMTSSRDGGETWTKNIRLNDTPIDRTIGTWVNNIDVLAPVAIASSNDGAVVAWSDTRNGNTISQTQDIYTSRVTFGEESSYKVTGWQAGLAGLLFGLGVAMCLAVFMVRRQNQAAVAPAPGATPSEPVATPSGSGSGSSEP